jgi:hypothetical protein
MSDFEWEEIHGFDGWQEYESFTATLESRIQSGQIKEVPVTLAYNGTSMHQRWFAKSNDHRVWRLVKPDPPFAGVFEPLPGNNNE